MKSLPKAIANLIDEFEKLPGIGPKTAARLAFYLLHVPQEQLERFGSAVRELKLKTKRCTICFNIGETDPCVICEDTMRQRRLICVVEQPLDVLAFERTGKFDGVYHVLHGAISPLNNIGPDDLFIPQLISRIKTENTNEIILATNPTMEGEATAMYIAREVKNQQLDVKITRLAHGLPIGGDVEYADEITLSRALEYRRNF